MSGRREGAVGDVDAWLHYAANDLLIGERALQEPAAPELACTHAQQAAEKALKAYLLRLSDERVPRTHDLGLLVELVVQRGGVEPPPDPVSTLAAYPADIRYPGHDVPSEEEARQALRLAREVLAFVRAQLLPAEQQ